MELAVGGVATLGLGYFSFNYIRSHTNTTVNCWYCNEDAQVPWPRRNDFRCPHCEQYNGFTESGNIRPDGHLYENVNKRFCVNAQAAPDVIPTHNGLCGACNERQELMMQQLNAFEPTAEKKFHEEYDALRYRLDQIYPLCSKCSVVAHNKQQEDKMKYSYLLDLKYRLFPVIRSGIRQAGRLTANLVKRRRRRFFSGGPTTVSGHLLTLLLSTVIFAAHFNFLQEDADVVFIPFPTVLRQLLGYACSFSLHLALTALLFHLAAMTSNECRTNFPDLILPGLLGLHAASCLFSYEDSDQDLVLFRCGVSALFTVMALIVAVVPRKRLHRTKPNRILTSAFSVASTPQSQCSSQNDSLRSLSTPTPTLTKQMVRERYQWREQPRLQTPEPELRHRKRFVAAAAREQSPEAMDWEPSTFSPQPPRMSPAPSVISLSSFTSHSRVAAPPAVPPRSTAREVTPSRHLASTLSSLSIDESLLAKRPFTTPKSTFGGGGTVGGSIFGRTPAPPPTMVSGMTSASRMMRPLQQRRHNFGGGEDSPPRPESIFTSVSQQRSHHSSGSSNASSSDSQASKMNYAAFWIIGLVLVASVAVNMTCLYYFFRQK